MDMIGIISTIASLLGTLSIWEIVKYLLNRKTNKRKEEAEADTVEFAVLRDGQASQDTRRELQADAREGTVGACLGKGWSK